MLRAALLATALTATGIVGLGAASLETKAPVTAPAATADVYNVDAVHSAVVFRIKHMKVAWFWGRFNEMSGTYMLNGDSLEGGSVEIEIKTDSVDTNSEGRDRHLRSPDFFNTKQFPTSTFKSTSITKKGDMYEIAGDLTINGETKAVKAMGEFVGVGQGRGGGTISGFEATLNIKRSEFGITQYLPDALGDDVRIVVSVEGAKTSG